MKVFLTLTMMVIAGLAADVPSYPKADYPATGYSKSYDYAPMPYNFNWAVKDDPSYNDFAHQESSDGKVVSGSYRVLLPDGRTQIVTYKADGYGYVADVQYQGEAKYDYKPAYNKPATYPAQPTYPAAAAYPKPSYTPEYTTPAYATQTYSTPAYTTPYSAPASYPKPSYPQESYPARPAYPQPSYPTSYAPAPYKPTKY